MNDMIADPNLTGGRCAAGGAYLVGTRGEMSDERSNWGEAAGVVEANGSWAGGNLYIVCECTGEL